MTLAPVAPAGDPKSKQDPFFATNDEPETISSPFTPIIVLGSRWSPRIHEKISRGDAVKTLRSGRSGRGSKGLVPNHPKTYRTAGDANLVGLRPFLHLPQPNPPDQASESFREWISRRWLNFTFCINPFDTSSPHHFQPLKICR